MKVHFIAIGGSAMHNLAIALHKKGFEVSGSDDEIFEPSKSRLNKHGLLPEKNGWDSSRISHNLDAVILGMHARKNNPELQKAEELGVKIYSYPEYLYEQSKDKIRVVIGGSHGKTSITAMILHVMHYWKKECDYMVGAQLEGFDTMVRLTNDAEVMILEGDEYLSSPIDLRPKFHLYQPNIALISGIAWDHINVFPTFENYVEQFEIFVSKIRPNGSLIYCVSDPEVKKIAESQTGDLELFPYQTPPHKVREGITYLLTEEGEVQLKIFGEHNLQNLHGAKLVLSRLGIPSDAFYEAIKSFSGASKRLEIIAEGNSVTIFKDFAHSPSKLKATTSAVKTQFPDRELIACMELHTFSSLNETFLDEYDGSMKAADMAFVYYNEHTLTHKKLPPISEEKVRSAFNSDNVRVYTNSQQMAKDLEAMNWASKNLLLMSSGNFDGIDLNKFGESLISDS